MARDRGGPPLALQLLEVPVTDISHRRGRPPVGRALRRGLRPRPGRHGLLHEGVSRRSGRRVGSVRLAAACRRPHGSRTGARYRRPSTTCCATAARRTHAGSSRPASRPRSTASSGTPTARACSGRRGSRRSSMDGRGRRRASPRPPRARGGGLVIAVVGEALIDAHRDGDLLRLFPGGGPFNTAIALGRLGTPTCYLGAISRGLARPPTRTDAPGGATSTPAGSFTSRHPRRSRSWMSTSAEPSYCERSWSTRTSGPC